MKNICVVIRFFIVAVSFFMLLGLVGEPSLAVDSPSYDSQKLMQFIGEYSHTIYVDEDTGEVFEKGESGFGKYGEKKTEKVVVTVTITGGG